MAGQELASLVLSVDTRPMDAATVSMDKATSAADRLTQANERLAKAGSSVSATSAAVKSATTDYVRWWKEATDEQARISKISQSRDIELWKNSVREFQAAEKAKVASQKVEADARSRTEAISQARDVELWKNSVREFQAAEKAKLDVQRAEAEARARVAAIEQARDTELWKNSVREFQSAEKAKVAESKAAAAERERISRIEQSRDLEMWKMRVQAAKEAQSIGGIRSPQAVADELRSLAAARDAWEQAGRGAQGYSGAMAQITARTNVLTEGNARARGAIRETAAAMASLAFEAAGAAFLVTAVGGALAAPAFFGVSMLKRVEDAQTGIAGILMSMGTLDGKALTFEQSMAASGEYVKKIQEDSLKFGIEMGKLVEVNQAAMSGGLAAMLTLDQIQKVATAGAIAVSSLGLNSQQYVQEVRDLISGGIQPASSTLARSIGVTDALLKQWKAEGPAKLVGELTTRLEGFVLVADKVRASTLTGAWDILQARLAVLMSDTEGFGALKKVVIDVANYIGTVDQISNKFTLNPQLVETVRSYWDILKSVGATLVEIGKAFASLTPIIQVAASAIASVAKYLTEIVVVSSALAGARWFAGLITSASAATISVGGLTAAMRAFVTSNPILVATAAIVAGIAAVTEGFDSATRSMKAFEQSMKGMAVNELYAQRQKLQTQLMLEEKSWMRNGALVSQYRQEISLLTREINRAESGKPTGGASTLGAITGTPQVDEAAKKKAAADADKAAKKAREEAIKANTDYVESQMKVGAEIDRESESLKKKIEQDQFEIASIGKTKEEIALLESTRYDHTTTMMREQLAILDSTNACTAESEALRENIKLRDKYKAVQVDKAAAIATQERVKAEQKAYEDLWKSVDGVAHDTFMNITDKGKNAFAEIGKAIKKSILEMLYQMTVQKWILNISASGTGTAVGSAVSAVSGAASAGGGIGSWLSAGQSLWSAFSGGMASTMGAIASGAGSLFGSTALTELGAGMSAIGGGGVATGIGGMTGLGETLGAAAPWLTVGALVLPSLFDAAFGKSKGPSGPTTMRGSFSDQGFGASAVTPWYQKGGWFSASGSGEYVNPLPEATTKAMNAALAQTKSAFDSLVRASGDAAASLTGWSFAFNQQVTNQEQATALIKDMANSMGAYLIPSLSAFQKEGENLADTAVRMRDEFILTDSILALVGGSFGAVGLASMAARDNLVTLMGGIQQMSGTMQSYYANFFTDSERHAKDLAALSAQFASIGVAMPDTAAGFRALVEAQDLSTESGRKTFAALMSLNGAFAALIPNAQAAAQATAQAATDAVRAAEQALQAAKSAAAAREKDALAALRAAIDAEKGNLTSAYNSQLAVMQSRVDSITASIGKLSELSRALHSTVTAMGVGVTRASAQAQIASTLAIARAGGVLPNAADLQNSLNVLAQPSEQLFGSFTDYMRDFVRTSNDIKALADISDSQLTEQESALKLAQNQIDLLTANHNDSIGRLDAILASTTDTTAAVLSVADALAAYNSAKSVTAALTTPSAVATTDKSAKINDMYRSVLGRSAETAGLSYWTEQAAAGMSLADVYKNIVRSPEAIAKGVPQFASGGDFVGGLRIVGENGPELEATGASRIFNASQTRQMLGSGGSSNEETNTLLRELIAENHAMRIELAEIKRTNLRMWQTTEQWDVEGMPDLREVA